VSRYDLSVGAPPELAALPWVYVLGVGGPEDAAGIGQVDRFVWRFVVLDDGPLPVVLGFRAMPDLMAFTRAVNGTAPQRVPTEAVKVSPAAWHGGIPAILWLDPSPDAFDAAASGRPLGERRIPELAL